MKVKKTWALEFWRDGKIERWHVFNASAKDAVAKQKQFQKETKIFRVLLTLLDKHGLAA